MTLPDLIAYFNDGGSYEAFCKTQSLTGDAEDLTIYAQKPFGLNSKLEFFPVNETAGKAQYDYNGAEFYSLFEFNYFLNALKAAQKDEALTDIDLALRLLDYAEKDS